MTYKLWTKPTDVTMEDLNAAILQVHHASQFLAMAGKSLLPPASDDSHTNVAWEEDRFAGRWINDEYRLCLLPVPFTLELEVKDGDVLDRLELDGQTNAQIEAWLREALPADDAARFSTELHYEIPHHPVADGTAYAYDNEAAFTAATIWRSNASLVLSEAVRGIEGAAEVRVWPHHFDSGSFIAVTHNAAGKLTGYIGVGYNIADSMITEPYYYVSGWVAEETGKTWPEKLTSSAGGKWMMPTWNGAILTLSEVQAAGGPADQGNLTLKFLGGNIDTALGLIR